MPPKILFTFLAKAIIYKNEALAILSTALSLGITPYLNTLLIDTEPKNLVFPIVIFAVGSTAFFLHVLLDFLTGIYASKTLNERKEIPDKSYIKSYKLWSTLWKLIGLNLFCALLTLTAIGMEVADISWGYNIFLYAQMAIWLLGCGFEFHSVGENIGKYSETVSPIFKFIDKLLDIFQLRFLSGFNQMIRAKVDTIEAEKVEDFNNNEKENSNEKTI